VHKVTSLDIHKYCQSLLSLDLLGVACVLLENFSVCYSAIYLQNFDLILLQLFYGSLNFVRDIPGELVLEETFTHSCQPWSSIIPYLLHLLRSMAFSVFNLRALQSISTISVQVFFSLPLGLAPSTSYSIHSPNHCLLFAAHAHACTTVSSCIHVACLQTHVSTLWQFAG